MVLSTTKKGIVLSVYVQPRGSVSGIEGVLGDSVKVRLTSPPAEGRANDELVYLLSKKLGIPRKNVEIVSGLKGRKKRVLLRGISAEEVREKLSLDGR